MSTSDLLEVERLACAVDGRPFLADVTFAVAPGEFVVLLGPNGSGKTTLLRCLVGLEPISDGAIRLAGTRVDARPPHQRGIGMLFQEPALFDRRTVFENIAYGLEVARRPPAEVAERVAELVALVHLEGFEDRRAGALSGGERQRVALARTLAPRPALILLDEPFAAVDARLRTELLGEFRDVLGRQRTAAIHVTHDRDEGLFLGDRILLLLGGRLVQEGPPSEVFDRPERPEAARFLGYNVFETDGRLVAVHPRRLTLGDPGTGRFDARVVSSGSTGTETLVFLAAEGGRRVEARGPGGARPPRPGTVAGVGWTEERPLRPARGA